MFFRTAYFVRFFVFCAALGLIQSGAQAAGNTTKPNLVTRDEWNARAPQCAISQMERLTRAIVHHTASAGHFSTGGLAESKANVRSVQALHMDTNGWCDIAYHFLVDKHGNVFVGRKGSVDSLPRGAHDGDNSNSFGFTLLGYFHPPYDNPVTDAMKNQLAHVIAWRMPNGWDGPYGSPGPNYGYLNNNVGYVDGHRNVKATACPGDKAYNIITDNKQGGWLRNEIKYRITH